MRERRTEEVNKIRWRRGKIKDRRKESNKLEKREGNKHRRLKVQMRGEERR